MSNASSDAEARADAIARVVDKYVDRSIQITFAIAPKPLRQRTVVHIDSGWHVMITIIDASLARNDPVSIGNLSDPGVGSAVRRCAEILALNDGAVSGDLRGIMSSADIEVLRRSTATSDDAGRSPKQVAILTCGDVAVLNDSRIGFSRVSKIYTRRETINGRPRLIDCAYCPERVATLTIVRPQPEQSS